MSLASTLDDVLRAGGGRGHSGVYLDGFATTALAPEARAAMLDALELPANPSSPHALGERAARIVSKAKTDIASLAGCLPTELVITSGATEANNLIVTGGAFAAPAGRRRIVVSAIEHRAVLEPAAALAASGFEVVLAPIDSRGLIDLAQLPAVIGEGCWLISIMAVNNETGVVQPVSDIARIAHEHGALFHTDAAQALGKMPVDVEAWDVDYASISAHKMHGPVGVGALYIAAGAPRPRPLQVGGGQQAGMRAGTEPIALVAGFGAAAAVALDRGQQDAELREATLQRILDVMAHHQVHWKKVSGDAPTIPGGCALVIDGVDADELCQRVQNDIYLSTSSACSAGQITMSHVLDAMGVSPEQGKSTLRIMTGRFTSLLDAERAGAELARAAQLCWQPTGRNVQ
jgi:cysteine desulfurase